MNVPTAANVLGTIGAVCWSVQLLPQIVINYRRHNTVGLQRTMMLLWACAGVPLGVYNITQGFNVALQVQPQILTTLSLITWIQCYHYDDEWRALTCVAVVVAVMAVFGGIEAGLVFALREGINRDIQWPTVLMGVLSTVLLSAGVLRHYYDIYVHHTVRGISFIFVAIDAAGDLFSLISIFFQPTLDILGMVIYAAELTLWTGVFVCGGYFNLIPWVRERISRRKQQQHSRDERSRAAEPHQLEHIDISNDLTLHQTPSSTSVFRTPSALSCNARSRRRSSQSAGRGSERQVP